MSFSRASAAREISRVYTSLNLIGGIFFKDEEYVSFYKIKSDWVYFNEDYINYVKYNQKELTTQLEYFIPSLLIYKREVEFPIKRNKYFEC